jgi:hypothetical protein
VEPVSFLRGDVARFRYGGWLVFEPERGSFSSTDNMKEHMKRISEGGNSENPTLSPRL